MSTNHDTLIEQLQVYADWQTRTENYQVAELVSKAIAALQQHKADVDALRALSTKHRGIAETMQGLADRECEHSAAEAGYLWDREARIEFADDLDAILSAREAK